ncbi:NAC domain-containing protein 74-like [Phalaenopsis equestris]|uniref:NAC domain-containing protein 74-like n=1 Tax=Phalaenopsis equestris TaxID=78828 RepID=UPI0009E56720|nr:NAC domain-containing protein 74-like [Phalaenopsis equestris]XP_020588799.1 NAC domain-containing protein 74-like [Phalaenopsis equestris]XP_020588800.1 NAC domain-containing protein 74-like [Phalaenopsis equestris]XP_020588801.1 NAC domain-containing protein 74-like [Phalaenopsis equestris]
MDVLKAISLPLGFGFHPTDVELISHYLKMKNSGQKIDYEVIPELDICKCEPWDLPACCQILTKDSRWHFFTSRDRKYPNGTRSNRATVAGYWKSTGKDRSIRFQNRVIGTKKTLVFHKGRPPRGKRTDWIMHEYCMDEKECKRTPGIKDSYVLCRVTKRDGFEVEGEKVSAQSEEIDGLKVAEGVDSLQNQGIRHDESSSPESAEALESWLNELLDPNFDGSLDFCCLNDLSSPVRPTKELQMSDIACTTPTPTNEPLEYGILSEEILGILGDDFNAIPEITQSLAAHPVNQETNSAIEDFRNETPDLSQNSNFIQIRERREEPPAVNFPYRIMLAHTSKMESRNISSLKETIECAQADRCIRSNSILKLPTMLELSDQILVKESKQKCVRIKAGMDYSLLCACMIGVACLIIIYFLLRDFFRTSGSLSALELEIPFV